jgi:hypothetical protein
MRVGKRLLAGLVGAVAVVLVLVGPAGALAATSPLTVGTGSGLTGVSVGVEANGTAVVSWADQSVPTANAVRWCVVAPGAGGCTGGGVLAPAGGPAPQVSVYRTQVVVDGQTVAILADIATGSVEYESVQEWQSTNGGQTFTAVNSGGAVASGNTSPDTRLTNAIVLPGGNSLGAGFVTPVKEPTFHAFSLTSATLCGRAAGKCADGFATLGSEANVDRVSNPPANFATDGNGVLGVFRTNAATGNLGCSGANPFGMAYVYGTGLQSPSNNYNLSPGVPASAWRTPTTLADCDVDYLAAGGGPSGFGVLEDNLVNGTTQYHRFDSATQSFDLAPTLVSNGKEQQPSVSQDGAGGVYATYLNGGIGGPVALSYSADGGLTWAGPATIAADPLGSVAGLTSAVDAVGQGWAAWSENGSVFLQPFSAADVGAPPVPAPTPPATTAASTTLTTSQKAGDKSGASITVPAGTTGETDTATLSGANAAHAGGTVTYALFSLPICAGTSLIAQSSAPVSGGAVPASAPITTALAPGKYYWQASYGGDSANASSTSACGSEVLTVADPNAIAPTATSDGTDLTVGLSCANVPCAVDVGLTTPEAGAATASVAKKAKPKTISLGKGKFKIKKKGVRKLTVKLSARGRKFLTGKSKAKIGIAVTEKIGGHAFVTKRDVSVKVSRPRRASR